MFFLCEVDDAFVGNNRDLWRQGDPGGEQKSATSWLCILNSEVPLTHFYDSMLRRNASIKFVEPDATIDRASHREVLDNFGRLNNMHLPGAKRFED